MQFPLLKSIENTYTPVAGTHSICMPRKQASRNITYIHNTEHRTQTHYTGTTLSTQEQLSNCGNRSDPALVIVGRKSVKMTLSCKVGGEILNSFMQVDYNFR